jgi:hypothetical protein
MITPFQYDGIVTFTRNRMALLCLAMLCLVLLWVVVLPLCFVFSPAIKIAGLIAQQPHAPLPGFSPRLPARAPPAIS